MADITVDVNLPSSVSVDVTSPTQVLATNVSIPGPQGPRGAPTSINTLIAENIIITGADGNIVYTSGTSTIFISGNSGYFQSAVNSLTTNLNSTGANLNTSINNLSGLFTGYTGNLDNNYATDAQLENTGSTLNTKIDNLSGYVNSQDSNISNNLASTGSVLQSNINTLSSNLNSTGSNLENKINSLSGTLTGNYATIVNLASTGSTLSSNINSLSGLFTGYTGTLDATFASDIQLENTGTTLVNSINSLSGTLTGNYLTTNSASSTYATITNLNLTGSTLNSSISSLSGTLTSDYATIINLASTGSNLQNQINNLDNVYATDASVTSVANNLASTGNALETKIGSLSGTLTNSYATISNLALTGSNLNTKIDNFSGTYQNFVDNLDSTYATDVQLQNTGTSLNNSISSLSGTLTSNYATINNLNSTGSTLETNIASTGNTLNLSINSLSGTLTSTYATITNLASTGSTLNSSINSLSGTLTSTYATINNLANTGSTLATDLASTGLNLDTKINTLSGSSVLLYGNQTISGLKDFTTRPTVNTTPVLLSGEATDGLHVFVKNDDSVTLRKGQPVYINGANGANILVKRSDYIGDNTSSKTLGLLAQDLAPNDQGFVITEGDLHDVDTSLAGSAGDAIWLGPTGSVIYGLVNKPYAPNHLVYLGVVERKHANVGKIYVKVQNGFELEELHNVNIDHKNVLNDNDIIRYNSASGIWFNETLNTGTFQTQINSLSGSSVLLYGDQTIDGTKTFRNSVYIHDLYVTGTEFIANVENNFIQSPYILLNLTGGAVDGGIFFVTGSGLTGINDVGPIIGFDHTDKFKFGISSRGADLSTLNDIAAFQDITAYSGFVDGKYATIINLASTGSTLSTNLASTGSTLQTQINNLGTTYATVTNLASTGSTLDSKINSLSGTLTSTYATISNLASTGSTLTTNLASTGSTLNSSINSLSGTLISDYATISNLASTGSTLVTNLASTGSTLQTNINNLSGYINSTSSNIVFTTGDQTISGNKTFNNTITTRTISGLSGVNNAFSISLNGIDNAYNIFSSNFGGGFINLNAGSGNYAGGGINLNGGKAGNTPYGGTVNVKGNVSINGTNSSELASRTINIYKTGFIFGSPAAVNALTIDNDNVSLNTPFGGGQGFGLLISGVPVTPALYATITNLASTGSTLDTKINSLSGTLTSTYATISNLASTGSTLVGSINSLSGTLTSTYATITNLASTGSTLNTRINNLSGYINSTSSNIVFTTGNQIISGIKTFAENTTFGDTGEADFLVISGNNFTVYGSGNFTSGLFVNSSPVLTGSSTLYATTVNLALTGSNLNTQIENAKKLAIAYAIAL